MKQRVLTALIGMPVALGAVLCAKPWPLAALLAAVGVLSMAELSRLFPSGRRFDAARLAAGLAALGAGALMALRGELWGLAGLLFILGLFFSLKLSKNRSALAFGLASFWIAVPLAAFFRLWQMGDPEAGAWWNLQAPPLLVLLPLWAGDTAGILVGRRWGRRPLAPKISPKKTREGALANAAACLAMALAAGWQLGLPAGPSFLCGAVCAVFGQAGDLFESHLKRLAEVKDSGSLLPGHGGILDRIDSALFSAPLVAMALGFWR